MNRKELSELFPDITWKRVSSEEFYDQFHGYYEGVPEIVAREFHREDCDGYKLFLWEVTIPALSMKVTDRNLSNALKRVHPSWEGYINLRRFGSVQIAEA